MNILYINVSINLISYEDLPVNQVFFDRIDIPLSVRGTTHSTLLLKFFKELTYYRNFPLTLHDTMHKLNKFPIHMERKHIQHKSVALKLEFSDKITLHPFKAKTI